VPRVFPPSAHVFPLRSAPPIRRRGNRHVSDPWPPSAARSRPVPSFGSRTILPPQPPLSIISSGGRFHSLPYPAFQKYGTEISSPCPPPPSPMDSSSSVAAAAVSGGNGCSGWETPKREECRIPATLPCPAAPRKAVPDLGKRRTPPKNGYFQPPDLEALFALAPRRQASSCA
jgi:hypothetical protein